MTDRKANPKCPLCGRDRQMEFRPFCSARCRDLDLSKWLDGSYAVPVVEDDESQAYDQDPARVANPRPNYNDPDD